MIYANGTPVADIPGNAAFYRDFAPGTYRFTVQPYGSPNKKADTVQLVPGTQTYLEVQWTPTWEEGYSTGGRHSFFTCEHVAADGARLVAGVDPYPPALSDSLPTDAVPRMRHSPQPAALARACWNRRGAPPSLMRPHRARMLLLRLSRCGSHGQR